MTHTPAHMHRRMFLQSAAMAAAGLALPSILPARALAQGAVSAAPVGANSAVFTGAGANVFATRGADGLILVDTGAGQQAEALRRALGNHFQESRVDAAFNTHWHYENTGGNGMARESGARIFAHENTRLWLDGDFYSQFFERNFTPRPAEALPTDTFYDSGAVTLGGRQVEYVHHKRSHTDGDIVVHFPDEDVIVAGDLVTVGTYPVFDFSSAGWIGAYSRTSQALLDAAGPDTKIVPGVGPVVGRDHLEKQTQMLATVRERIFEQVRLGRGAEEMLAAGVTEGFDAEWGDPTAFVMSAYPGLWAYSYEVGRVV